MAQADTLGILGREGVYAAAFWPLSRTHPWSFAAWRAFRNYDGAGHHFGDTSVSASTSDLDHVSGYASTDASSAARVVLVLVHRPTLSSAGTFDLKARNRSVEARAGVGHRQDLAAHPRHIAGMAGHPCAGRERQLADDHRARAERDDHRAHALGPEA